MKKERFLTVAQTRAGLPDREIGERAAPATVQTSAGRIVRDPAVQLPPEPAGALRTSQQAGWPGLADFIERLADPSRLDRARHETRARRR